MTRAKLFIVTEGMEQMENDFARMATPEPIETSKERLSETFKIGFEAVQASIPEDEGDYRRPAGTLRDSARYEVTSADGEWTGTIAVGTEDDEAPYAKWVLYKNIDKPGGDYLEPMDEAESRMEEAMNAGFDEVFGTGD
jgi:hypothetical protein